MTKQGHSRNEEEYFARLDADLLKDRRSALDLARKKIERATHFMKCPRCGGDLKEVEHHHVTVDRCSECKGVWLDSGELERLEHTYETRVTRLFSSVFGRHP